MDETEDKGILGLGVPLDDSLLESVLVNNLISVEGEESLASKVTAYVADAELWLRRELALDDCDHVLTPQAVAAVAVRCVVLKAVVTAIPSLDLVVTPSGFGVVSSSSIAPASKERVERLVDSLSTALDGNLASLFDLLAKDCLWRDRSLPSALCSTFFRLRDALQRTSDPDLFSRFRAMRDAGLEVMNALESQFLGYRLMRLLRIQYHDAPEGELLPLTEPIRMASLRYFRALRSRPSARPDEQDIWHTAQAVIDRLPQFPDLYDEWRSEMGHTVHVNPAVQSRPGAYCF